MQGGLSPFEARVQQLPAPHDVRLFSIDLSGPDPAPEHCVALGPRERERARRFVTSLLRRRYRWSRVLLKDILVRVCGHDLGGVDPVVSARGRPAFSGLEHDFNLSHSGDRGLIGVRLSPGRIGVDVEALKLLDDGLAMARLCFSQREQEEDSMAGLTVSQAFLRRWTCKESVLKAVGVGLLDDMKQVEFAFPTPDQVALVAHPFELTFDCHLIKGLDGFAAAYALSKVSSDPGPRCVNDSSSAQEITCE